MIYISFRINWPHEQCCGNNKVKESTDASLALSPRRGYAWQGMLDENKHEDQFLRVGKNWDKLSGRPRDGGSGLQRLRASSGRCSAVGNRFPEFGCTTSCCRPVEGT